MVLINYAGREINAKIVYYGPGLSGKTTNLECIYASVPKDSRGKMVSMKTRQDRTLFFDFLPLELGEVHGFRTRFLLYTVPGQVFYNATRKLVLKGADAVVFVADSQLGKMDDNAESLRNLQENLAENNLSLDKLPWVIQYNKRDLEDLYSIDELQQILNPYGAPYYEAAAATGRGVYETLHSVSRLLFQSLLKELKPAPGTRPAAAGPPTASQLPLPAPNAQHTPVQHAPAQAPVHAQVPGQAHAPAHAQAHAPAHAPAHAQAHASAHAPAHAPAGQTQRGPAAPAPMAQGSAFHTPAAHAPFEPTPTPFSAAPRTSPPAPPKGSVPAPARVAPPSGAGRSVQGPYGMRQPVSLAGAAMREADPTVLEIESDPILAEEAPDFGPVVELEVDAEYADLGRMVDLSSEPLQGPIHGPGADAPFIKDPLRRGQVKLEQGSSEVVALATTYRVPVVVSQANFKSGTTIRIVLDLRVES